MRSMQLNLQKMNHFVIPHEKVEDIYQGSFYLLLSSLKSVPQSLRFAMHTKAHENDTARKTFTSR